LFACLAIITAYYSTEEDVVTKLEIDLPSLPAWDDQITLK